tara:strand:- start:16 stop:204 length:189 start_codon:yes stop_codon:yes gene_type:complete
MSEEQLEANLNAIFRYARIHSVTHNDSDEELIAIIQCKEKTMKRLFPKQELEVKEIVQEEKK